MVLIKKHGKVKRGVKLGAYYKRYIINYYLGYLSCIYYLIGILCFIYYLYCIYN